MRFATLIASYIFSIPENQQPTRNRRAVLKGALGVTAMSALTASPLALLAGSGEQGNPAAARFGFSEIEHGVDETHHVAPATARTY